MWGTCFFQYFLSKILKMHFRPYHYISALFFLLLCFSCKEKEEPVPPYKDIVFPAQNILTLILGSGLPIDSQVTPVFTMDGEAPIYLEEFLLDKFNRTGELSFVFIPKKEDWNATLHFIVTPLRGWNEPIFKDYRMDVMKFLFSANLPEEYEEP